MGWRAGRSALGLTKPAQHVPMLSRRRWHISEADLVRAAYNKAEFLAERKALLAAWADYLLGDSEQSDRYP